MKLERMQPCIVKECDRWFRDKSGASRHLREDHWWEYKRRLRTVAALAGLGLTDRELAQRLRVGIRTAWRLRQLAGVVRTPEWGWEWRRRTGVVP